MEPLHLRMNTDPPPRQSQFEAMFRFLAQNGLADRGSLQWLGQNPAVTLPPGTNFTLTEQDLDLALNIGFLDQEFAPTAQLLSSLKPPMFLAGWAGIPSKLSHVCVPFERKRFGGDWLDKVLTLARNNGWKVRLIHCDHGLVAHEIIRLADWFHLESVKEALENWLTDEVRQRFRRFLQDCPETEIKTGVGKLHRELEDEDAQKTMIMGALSSGYHLPQRHHGLNYSGLLKKTGLSGYFISG